MIGPRTAAALITATLCLVVLPAIVAALDGRPPVADQATASANARPQAPVAQRRNSAEDDGPDGPTERK